MHEGFLGGRFNSRLREEATTAGMNSWASASVSTHASVRRRLGVISTLRPSFRFQLTPP